MKAKINGIQRFCYGDGPGIRTTVFLSGCPLRCKWCHNPETQTIGNRLIFIKKNCINCKACAEFCNAQKFIPQRFIDRELCDNCGKCTKVCPVDALKNSVSELDCAEIIDVALKDKAFYGNAGGVTFSGGEPTFQKDAIKELLYLSKKAGLNTAIETCGSYSPDFNEELCKNLDLALFDVKDTFPERLKKNTGADFDLIIENLHSLDDLGVKTIMRCIIIAGINDNIPHIKKLKAIKKSLKNVIKAELLPYHCLGKSKYENIGLNNTFDDESKIPAPQKLEELSLILNYD